MWWENAVIYQVYVRSFQDTDGDGVGDLPGVTERLEHIAGLGASAVWLSPIYPSPNYDYGYDVSDFTGVDPSFGTVADLDALVARASELGLKVLLDFVPCHTSTAHPWFREHPDYYVWADEPPNNWRAAFGGAAWGRDEQTGRWFLHSFFPEQADLNWRNPEVRAQMTAAMRFWLDRGVDGFRLDALDRLMKDPQLRDDPPATAPPALPGDPQDLELDHIHSRNSPDLGEALAEIRAAVGDALLIGEVYLPVREAAPYLSSLDVVFNFEAIFAVAEPANLRSAVEAGLRAGGQGWVLSNHDFNRLVTRAGDDARAVMTLLLTLPGPAFVFQGDELGYPDLATEGPELDRHHRDMFRVPMIWDDAAPGGGFTTGEPWLRAAGPTPSGVQAQSGDPGSMLSLVRAVVKLRAEMAGDAATLLDSAELTIVLQRGAHVVAINLGDHDQPAPQLPAAELALEVRPGDGRDLTTIPAHGGWIVHTR